MAAKKKTTEETPEQRSATEAMDTEQAGQTASAPEEEVHGEQTTAEAAEVPETPADSEKDVAGRSAKDSAPQEAGQPRRPTEGGEAVPVGESSSPTGIESNDVSEAFPARNASDSECRTGTCDRASSALESLSVLADRHRVAGWQQAALLRLMGWEDDKRVSDAEYRAALETLKSRRIGGGRR